MIELKNISKKFTVKNQSIVALNQISLSIKSGKIFGIIGKSGAGKSTLIRSINLLEIPDSGEVVVNGVNLLSASQAELTLQRRKMGMIFQHFNLLSSRTVFENVAFPIELMGLSKAEIKQKVHSLLEIVGILDKADQYPSNLSGGQKQRVAIARALANDPKVLLCDEATSALDPSTTKAILKLLKEINERLKITIVLITHEMDVITSICDEVAVMKQGEVVEHGTVEEIFTNPKQEITKKFIKKSLDIDLPTFYQKQILPVDATSNRLIYKLYFSNIASYSAIILSMQNNFNVNTQVISSKIEYAGAVNFGTFFLEVQFNENNEAAVAHFLKSNHFVIEKVGYVRSNN
ncbi:methionine ABC transporter ATP-binding protein [Flavobacterium agricola]|uniref:Methionine ABC transporter ATP-binding protein n=1 Tax=Flavobacterium agricola TaxID=2870839 RepID=A0ABY6LY98_9FLAO|nr:methionine ABC transporter ATP-binding protein [Flavobacterium agricola]UYW01214.1 methionine ABC transporter ATP-binding protein [Flavobacterium agricola]